MPDVLRPVQAFPQAGSFCPISATYPQVKQPGGGGGCGGEGGGAPADALGKKRLAGAGAGVGAGLAEVRHGPAGTRTQGVRAQPCPHARAAVRKHSLAVARAPRLQASKRAKEDAVPASTVSAVDEFMGRSSQAAAPAAACAG